MKNKLFALLLAMCCLLSLASLSVGAQTKYLFRENFDTLKMSDMTLYNNQYYYNYSGENTEYFNSNAHEGQLSIENGRMVLSSKVEGAPYYPYIQFDGLNQVCQALESGHYVFGYDMKLDAQGCKIRIGNIRCTSLKVDLFYADIVDGAVTVKGASAPCITLETGKNYTFGIEADEEDSVVRFYVNGIKADEVAMDEAAKACVKANDIKFIMAQVYGNAVCTLSVDNASVYYADNYTVVVGGETFGSTVGTFATSAAGGGDDRTKYAGWAELPVENGIQSDYYYAYHMRNDAAKIRNFSVCYSAKYRCPVWVAAPMHKSYVGSAKRKDNYINDPKISCTQNTEYDFKSTNLTRGHMLGSSDRTVSQATNDQVFYKSNIGPQLQNGFNTGGGVWNNCEDWVDTQWKGQADTTYQVIGCYWENESKKVNGTVVPTHYYKVLLRIKNHVNKWVVECSRDELQCVAICFPHNSSNGGTKPSQYVAKGFVMSVADLEKKTGQTFFANVPNAPKDTYNASDWGL